MPTRSHGGFPAPASGFVLALGGDGCRMGGGDSLLDILGDLDFGGNASLAGTDSPENLFDIFDALEGAFELPSTPLHKPGRFSPKADGMMLSSTSKAASSGTTGAESETDGKDVDASPAHKRLKCGSGSPALSEEAAADWQQRSSHILVERNRRKQMNEHLSVLRSLMPCFYVKRGDQASIIEGVVKFIKELQQVLKSLEEKKKRKVYSDVLSPRPVPSPRPPPAPLSPRIGLPISPRTPQPASPYNPRLQQHSLSPTKATLQDSPSLDNVTELAANSKSAMADVEVKFAGPNVLLKTTSPWIPGQALKIIAALEDLALEILQVNMSTVDETMLNSFTIKIGIECELSAEELANEIQRTFC